MHNALAMMVLSLPGPALAEEECEGLSFFTCKPNLPDFQLPTIKDLQFWREDSKKGRDAYRDGDDKQALKYFRRASDDGDLVADWYLGHMYRLGRGVEQSDAQAFSYYGRVADQFNADEPSPKKLKIMVDGLVRTGDYYRRGSKSGAIPQDFDRAIRTYKLAATYGHPAADYGLGVMNVRGQGVRAKPEQGLKWLMKAARKRHAPSEAYLGNLFWKGEFVKQDRTRALMWYMLAQATANPEEDPDIIDRLDVMLASATDEERIEAEARATVWADQYPVSGAK